MGIVLYKHNLEAYNRAVTMLESKGKAAIIHPTGTGKSFIGFKLCEDNQISRVCWLSPSEYIYSTQVENLISSLAVGKGSYDDSSEYMNNHIVNTKAAPSCLDNITFYTYAKLSYMNEGELSKILPDYIILDEFHRCGAHVWGTGVQRLLAMYPDAKLLGLSATAIRYLDNQRDMADELFQGNVASEMTLGEAIVRGILSSPKYVLSVFSYKDSLVSYEKRIGRLRYQGQRDKAERYLEALKRSLDKAEGLDELFDRYMTDRTGKYIVFCASYDAMKDAICKVPEWFGAVDNMPHVYSVYSEDPEADKAFGDFKEDNDKSHLRLLFCIDALNEGVHVDDISGVVLLRPTISPIVYKQQIGRSLTAGKSGSPVIFDIVGNIGGLYSIDSLREEMDTALNYILMNEDSSEVVNETFEILGEVKNCLELFGELEGYLSSSWDVMYLEAKGYYEDTGNLLMPMSYINEGGYPVGRWVHTQRMNRKKGEESLTPERIRKLDAIGMDWRLSDERSWQRGFEAASQFYKENGHLDVPAAYEDPSGFKLGNWYRHIRDKYQEGRLEAGYIEAMESIGMKWSSVFERRWMACYEQARIYFKKNGDLNVPVDYVVVKDDTIRLGVWISVQRDNYRNGRLSDEQITMLEDIGMSWDRFDSKWENAFHYAQEYKRAYGDINAVPESYRPDGFKLLTWIRAQRAGHNSGKLSEDRSRRLESLGIIWNPQEALWEKGYAHAVGYVKEHGDINVPPHYVCDDGYKLKSWLVNQGTRYKTGRMSEEQCERLLALGMVFGGTKERKVG